MQNNHNKSRSLKSKVIACAIAAVLVVSSAVPAIITGFNSANAASVDDEATGATNVTTIGNTQDNIFWTNATYFDYLTDDEKNSSWLTGIKKYGTGFNGSIDEWYPYYQFNNKIKEILFNSLPEDSNLKIITYDYPALIRKQVYDQLMNDYEVVCVIGTLDPNIESMKYIGIQELIINESQNAIEVYFGKYMTQVQMEIFEKNILRNFTLSNVMNNLTILNPDKLLEHVAKAIDYLQNILHKRFKNRTCFGLYVHICCLVERLVTRQPISNFTDLDFKEKHQEFIDQVNISMKEVKTYYNVEIPDEEIEYIYNYIIND